MIKTVAAAAIAAGVIASPVQTWSEPTASPPAPTTSIPAAPAPATTSAPSGDAPHVLYVTIDLKDKMPPFTASNLATAETGMIGGIASIAAGADIVKQNNVPDPSIEAARRFADLLAAKHGGVIDPPMVIELGKQAKAAPDQGGTRYVVMVVTTNWGYSWAGMTDFTHYVATYRAQVVLGQTGKPPIKTTCSVTPMMGGRSLDHDHLLGDSAAGLKSLLIEAAQKCVDEVKAKEPDLL